MSGSDIDNELDRHEAQIDQINDEIGGLQWQVALLAGAVSRLANASSPPGASTADINRRNEAVRLVGTVIDDDEDIIKIVNVALLTPTTKEDPT